jgi:hypothetical protein
MRFLIDFYPSDSADQLITKSLPSLRPDDIRPRLTVEDGAVLSFSLIYAGKVKSDSGLNPNKIKNIDLTTLCQSVVKLINYAQYNRKRLELKPTIVVAQHGDPSEIRKNVDEIRKMYPSIQFTSPEGSSPAENLWGAKFDEQIAEFIRLNPLAYVGAANTVMHEAHIVGCPSITLQGIDATMPEFGSTSIEDAKLLEDTKQANTVTVVKNAGVRTRIDPVTAVAHQLIMRFNQEYEALPKF